MQNTGTVTITIEEHDRLRNFEKSILNGEKIVMSAHHSTYNIFNYSETEIIKEMKAINTAQQEVIDEKNNQIMEQRSEIFKLKMGKEAESKKSFWPNFFGN